MLPEITPDGAPLKAEDNNGAPHSSAAGTLSPQGEGADLLTTGRAVLEAQSAALHLAAERLDENFARAVSLILSSHGKVIVTGLGKSGHIARKLAATLCSTGTRAVSLHASDATHGDLGIYSAGDPTIVFSKSGATHELVNLAPILRNMGSPLIAILGNLSSPLASVADVVLDARVNREADQNDIVPSCSSTVAMAIGDALAISLMQARRFGQQDFARNHPSGQLGRNLWLSVADVMHPAQATACVQADNSLREVVISMTRFALGAACVLSDGNLLAGLITDGDLRRALQQYDDIRPLRAGDVMTQTPVTISPRASLKTAETLMEARPSQISVLPVVDDANRYLGLLRIHDLYRR